MQTCETCRHWGSDDFNLKEDRRRGFIAPEARLGICDRAEDEGASRDPLFVANDAAGGGNASLRTRADFGCVAHEPRE